MSFIRVLFSFKGRIRRHIFWLKSLLPAALLATVLPFLPEFIPYAGVAKIIGYAIVLWIVMAGLAKRLHDRDHSGWLQVLFTGPVAAMLVLHVIALTQPWLAVGWFISGVIGIWIIAETGFIAGKSGHNRFGADPALYHNTRSSRRGSRGRGAEPENENGSEADPAAQAPTERGGRGSDRQPPELQYPAQSNRELIGAHGNGNGNGGGKNETPDERWDQSLADWRVEPSPEAASETAPDSGASPETAPVMPPIEAAAQLNQSENRRRRISELFSQPVNLDDTPGTPGADDAPEPGEIEPGEIEPGEIEPAETETAETGDADAPVIEAGIDLDQEPPPPLPAVNHEIENFSKKLLLRATDSAAHLRYLENAAASGNRWAKLETAATYLSAYTSADISAPNSAHNSAGGDNAGHTERGIAYLKEVAEAPESYLGVGKEASYFLGEIYRLGFGTTAVNEDLALKYLTRAASEGHKDAKIGLAAVISREKLSEHADEFTHPIIEAALANHEAAAALMQMLENDWSLSYQDGVLVVLRTLVDNGDRLAAKPYGKYLLETGDFRIAPLVLMRADVLDAAIIDKIMDIVQSGQADDDSTNALVDCINHHADKGDSYANYQMAVSYNNGIGVPQDDIMAFVHANLAASRVHGHERDHLTRLRDELKEILTDPELAEAQEIIRERFLK
ncbi:MAG: DUF805 domain-containing protein [Rhodospirillales bacterium]|nr:DUF805 domain-containing protein [Rhodospirillales bacterium]